MLYLLKVKVFRRKLSDIIGMARKSFALAITICYFLLWYRIYGNYGSNYDLSRFGAERMSFSPRQADILLVCEYYF